MYRISVIMGLYNCAHTLPEALDSLLAQTYQGFKVIMCDDGSKDNTLVIAQTYVNRFPSKFILIKNEHNMGLNYTLNHCLNFVDSEYVARMDGDDISLPTRFEKEIAFLERHPDITIVSTPMVYFDENGDYRTGKGGSYVTIKNFLSGSPFCHAPCMVRTEAYKTVEGYTVDKELLGVEDYHLWFKMYAQGYLGYVLDEALYKMRDDRNAASRRTFGRYMRVAKVMSKGFKMLKLPFWYQALALRPIVVACLPKFIYDYFHRRD